MRLASCLGVLAPQPLPETAEVWTQLLDSVTLCTDLGLFVAADLLVCRTSREAFRQTKRSAATKKTLLAARLSSVISKERQPLSFP